MPRVNPLSPQTCTTSATWQATTTINNTFCSTLQGSNSEENAASSKGFLATIFQPIGRFFLNLITYLKHLFCCCSTQKVTPLPQLKDDEIREILGLRRLLQDDAKFSYEQATNTYSVKWNYNSASQCTQIVAIKDGEQFAFVISGSYLYNSLSEQHKIILNSDSVDILMKGRFLENRGFNKVGDQWIREAKA